jgi:hypothetical protein
VLDVTRARGSLRGLIPAALFFVLATLIVAGLPWRCAFRQVTGLPCPTCGMTRAMRLALHGDFSAATQMHPLWFLVVPACVVVGIAEMAAYWRRGRWGTVIERRGVLWALGALGVALVVVWTLRISGLAFTKLPA